MVKAIDPKQIPDQIQDTPTIPDATAAETPRPTDALRGSGEPFIHTCQNGYEVVLQKYPRSESLVVAKALGMQSMNMALTDMYRTVLWVKSIKRPGERLAIQMPTLKLAADFDFVIEFLGDDTFDEISTVVWDNKSVSTNKTVVEEEVKNS